MPFWTYMLHCRGGKLYTGHTDDLDRRVAQHKAGAVAGFTRDHLPVELVWSQEFITRDEAKAAEQQIKGWSRAKKLALIRGDWDRISRLARSKSGPSTSSGQSDVMLSDCIAHQIRNHAQLAAPLECCGLLLGEGGAITEARPARNAHLSPQTHFEIDPQALIDAHRAARAGGPQVLGYYHSHPRGPAEPSATDRAMAARDGRMWAIVGQDGAIGIWLDGKQGFEALSTEAASR